MNIYRTEFFAFCPSNGVRIKYGLTIETTETIMAEQIVDEVTLHAKGYHEQIADDLFRSFGGRQTLVAHHHGVDIETRRPMGPCVACAGSGMVDRTGQGDLQACACRTAGGEPDAAEVARRLGFSQRAAEWFASEDEHVTAGTVGVAPVVPADKELTDAAIVLARCVGMWEREMPLNVKCALDDLRRAIDNHCRRAAGVKECECASGYCAREMGVPLRDSRCRTRGVVVDHHQGPEPSDADASKDRP